MLCKNIYIINCVHLWLWHSHNEISVEKYIVEKHTFKYLILLQKLKGGGENKMK